MELVGQYGIKSYIHTYTTWIVSTRSHWSPSPSSLSVSPSDLIIRRIPICRLPAPLNLYSQFTQPSDASSFFSLRRWPPSQITRLDLNLLFRNCSSIRELFAGRDLVVACCLCWLQSVQKLVVFTALWIIRLIEWTKVQMAQNAFITPLVCLFVCFCDWSMLVDVV